MNEATIQDNGFVLTSELETFLKNDASKISRRNFFTFREEEELINEALVEIGWASYDSARITGDRAKYDRTLIHHALVRAARKLADARSEWTRDRDSLDQKVGEGDDSATRGDFVTDGQTLGDNGPKMVATPTRQISRDLRNPEKRTATLAALADRDAYEGAVRDCRNAALAEAAGDSGASPAVDNAFEADVLREEKPDIWRDDAPIKTSVRTIGGTPNLAQLRLDWYSDVKWVIERFAPVDRRLCELVLEGWELGDAARSLGISPSRLSRTFKRRLQAAFAPVKYILGALRK